MDQYIGKMLDNRYEILEVIGVGGMAVVYKAMCHRLNRLVAVKILKDEYSRDEEFRRRFHGESQAVAMMSHPNIVNVYDVSRSDELDYIVMELIDGITLKQYMERKGVLNWRETLHFSMQIAKALEHAHGRNIIHRDIKPHNIMILKDGSVKVADFGIARVATAQNTLTKEALGSVHYISPEQAKGARVDNRTDLYSLGVVMYQMLTGRPPYDGDSPVSVAIQHINGTPLLPSLLNSNIPTGLEQITMHAMCADLSKRYGSATDMLRDMEEFRKNPSTLFSFTPEGSSIATAPSAQPANRPRESVAQPPVARPRQEDYDREQAEARSARNRQILTGSLIALGVAALIGLVILIISLLPKGGSDASNIPTESESEAEENRVPNLLGMKVEDARLEDYEALRFVIDADSYVYDSSFPEGTICKQSIAANTVVEPGTEVYLNISLGEKTGNMPMLSGWKSPDAEAAMRRLETDLEISWYLEMVNDDTVEEGYVIRTEPEEGTVLKAGETVRIYVSLGPESRLIRVPSVTQTPLSNAQSALTASKLSYTVTEEYSSLIDKGYVISQYPAADTEVEEGTVVSLVVSKGPQLVPNVIGMTESAAKSALDGMGLSYYVTTEYSDDVPEHVVIRQDPGPNTAMVQGMAINLVVSAGPKPTEAPPTESTEAPSETSAESPPAQENPEPVVQDQG